MKIKLNMVDLMNGDNCKCFKHGKEFNTRIKGILSGLKNEDKIIISLNGISIVSSSFAYTAFLPLTKWYGYTLDRDRVKFIDWNEKQKKMIDDIVEIIGNKTMYKDRYPLESLCI